MHPNHNHDFGFAMNDDFFYSFIRNKYPQDIHIISSEYNLDTEVNIWYTVEFNIYTEFERHTMPLHVVGIPNVQRLCSLPDALQRLGGASAFASEALRFRNLHQLDHCRINSTFRVIIWVILR